MRLGYNHEKDSIEANRYWNNTILPLLNNGSLENAVNGTYAYPNRVGLYPGMTCQFFCTFCGRNYDAKYKADMEREIARLRDFEVSKIKMEEAQKYREKLNKFTEEMETLHMQNIKELKAREHDTVLRIKEKER